MAKSFEDILSGGMWNADTGSIGDEIRDQAELEAQLKAMDQERNSITTPIVDESVAAGLQGPLSMPDGMGVGPRVPSTMGTASGSIAAPGQAGLNTIPFSPAINAFPQNDMWTPGTGTALDKIKNLGMLSTIMPEEKITAEVPKPSLKLTDTLPKKTSKKIEKGPYDESEEAEANAAADAVGEEQSVSKEAKPSEEDELKAAQEAKRRDQMLQAILKASANIGAAISGQGHIKADLSPIEAFDPLVGAQLEDLKEKRVQEKSMMELDKLRDQRKDDKAKADPTSEISQVARQMVLPDLRKLGMNDLANRIESSNASHKQIEDLFGQNSLANRINQHEASLARIAAANANREARKDSAQQRQDDKFQAQVQGLRKELMSGVVGKQYANYLAASRADKMVSEFAKNPTGYSDYGSLMGSLKALQGDESVVREAEIRLGMQATSLANKIANWTSSITSGKMLQPKQRQDMIKAIKILSSVSKEKFHESAAPIMAQAQVMGIDPKYLIGHEMSDTVETKAPAAEMSDKDKKAIEWAKANKNNPDAQAILKMHGM